MNCEKRYVWVCTSPKGNVRVYIKQENLEAELPDRVGFKKKALDAAGTKWQYGGGDKIFIAKRVPIQDTGIPAPPAT